MRALSAEDSAHAAQRLTTWAVCWRFTDRLGRAFRYTGHDRDITVDVPALAGLYQSALNVQATAVKQAADLSVDNLDLDTLLDDLGVTQADLRAGVLDDIRYTIFLVNWLTPVNSGVIIKQGVVGNFRAFMADLAGVSRLATIELRGLKQYVQQNIVSTYSAACRAQLGDARCGVDLAPLQAATTIASVISQRSFTVTLPSAPPDAGYFNNGLVEFTSGPNLGYTEEIKTLTGSGPYTVTLREPFPRPLAIADALVLTPGCDKTFATCKARFNNTLNFRGEPHVPGNFEAFATGINRATAAASSKKGA